MTLRRLLLISLLILAPFAAGAQDDPPPAADAAQPAAPEKLDLVALTEFLDQQRALVEQYRGEADTGLKNAEEAEARFDALIASYEKLIQVAGTESEIVGQIDRFVAAYQGFAESAASSSNPERRALADSYRGLANTALDLRKGFIAQARLAVTQLAELQSQKELAVDLYRLNEGKKVVAAFTKQLAALTAANQSVEGAINAARQGGLPVETGKAVQ